MKRNVFCSLVLCGSLLLSLASFGAIQAQEKETFVFSDSYDSSASSLLDVDEDLTETTPDVFKENLAIETTFSTPASSSNVVENFLSENGDLVGLIIFGLLGLVALFLACYVLIWLPIRFLRWLCGGGSDKKIYGEVIHRINDHESYVTYEDITGKVRWEKFTKRLTTILFLVTLACFLLPLFCALL